jgi:adenosylmethionine---8-amino-7-oxononanoate aminotransferase
MRNYARMNSGNNPQIELTARDLAHIWHPCTQMKDHEREIPMIPIRKGDGVWLEDFNGKRYLDGVSSWWVNLFGHANPRIAAAIAAQVQQLEHVIFAGFTHEPAVQLAESLTRIAPPGLNRVFFADNGSAAVEVAVKMSFHFWRNQGQPKKTKFVTLANSYHGETLGALAVGNVALYKDIYAPLLMDVITVPSPDAYLREAGETPASFAQRMSAVLRDTLTCSSEEIAAVIVEPLVQCAGGMRMYDPLYLSLLRKLCDEFNVHLIADEIAVGFGRTGTLFACEQAGITPDFLCLSKGLTGGFLPLSVVLTRDATYDAFYDEYAKLTAFLHSHSYTGNPLACAAANATLAIFRDEPVLERNRLLAAHMAKALEPLRDHPQVSDVRQCGMIAAVEMVRNRKTREPYAFEERRGLRVYRQALERGALLRPIGNVIYFMPPYIISTDQIDFLVDVARTGIEAATCD